MLDIPVIDATFVTMDEKPDDTRTEVKEIFIEKVLRAIEEKRLKPELGKAILESMGLPGESLISNRVSGGGSGPD